MGASLALAGLAGCTKQPDEPIYPYIKQPEDLVLGKPMYFATAHPVPHRRHPRAGQVGRLPSHQDRRQSRAPDVQGQVRRDHPGHAARPLRSRPLAARACTAARPASLGKFQQAFAAAAKQRTAARASTSCPKPSPRRRSPRSGSRCRQAYPAGEARAVGAGQPRLRPRRLEGRLRQLHRRAVQAGRRGRHPLARRGLPRRHRASRLPADGGGLCRASSLTKKAKSR